MTRRHAHKVLNHLREDSRKSLTAIAREENMGVSTIFDHVKQLETSIIEKHTSLLNYSKIGYPFRTFFYCEHDDPKETMTMMRQHKNTNNLLLISNNKFCLDMLFSTLQEEEQTRETLEEQGCVIQQHRVIEPVVIEGWKMR